MLRVTFTCAVPSHEQLLPRVMLFPRHLILDPRSLVIHLPSTRGLSSCRVLVVGAGTAGLAVASKLSRSLPSGSVALLDARQVRQAPLDPRLFSSESLDAATLQPATLVPGWRGNQTLR